MSIQKKIREEIRAVVLLTLYFGLWIGTLILLKKLILAQYQIEFYGLSQALVGALVLAKVVLILEHVTLGTWVRARPALLDVILRTMMYTFGVFIVLLLEKSFEGRHEHGGLLSSLLSLFKSAEGHKVWADVICISCALFVYNVFYTLKKIFGARSLFQELLKPLPDESKNTP